MCGLAGFSGIADLETRAALTFLLGVGIDARGGDAAGYVAIRKDRSSPTIGRKLGYWISAKDDFLRPCIAGDIVAMHARFATSGGRGLSEAHPFEIHRKNEPVIFGLHNGCIWNASDSAEKNGRQLHVDSEEIFHLLADCNIRGLQQLQGYGVITWTDVRQPGDIRLAKLSDGGEIYVCALRGGGLVWGSTKSIVHDALAHLGLGVANRYRIDTGKVYSVRADGSIYYAGRDDIRVSDRPRIRRYAPSHLDSVIDDDDYDYDYDYDDESQGARHNMRTEQWRKEIRKLDEDFECSLSEDEDE